MAKEDVVKLCIDQGAATYRAVNDSLLDFLRELGGVSELPEAFTMNVDAMRRLERRIDRAVAAGNLKQTEDLCGQYKRRFDACLERWRKQVGTQEVAT